MFSFFKLYSPEGFLIFTTIFLLVFNSFIISSKRNILLNIEIFIQILTLGVILLLLLINISYINIGYNFFFFTTYKIQNLKILLVFFFLNILVIIWRNFIAQKLNFFEFFIILNLTLLGLLFLLNSYNLISIYLCLEIQALGFYILACFDRTSIFSSEAGLKYFISSSLISGGFLFGSTLIYGSLGTLNFNEISILTIFFSNTFIKFSYFFFIFGCFIILNALLFKLVIAPFHFWFPQIYDGAPISSTIIFSILPKIALINLFIYFWNSIISFLYFFNNFFFIIGVYSVFFGTLKMLNQKKLKKLYIYSSISSFGLLLCILIDNTLESLFSIYFYLIIYLITSILFWIFFTLIYCNKRIQTQFTIPISIYLTYFNTFFLQNKFFALSVCFIFFSLAALPPFCGFLSKLYLFIILLKNFKYEFSFFLIYTGILGSYFYIKFLKVICFENLLLTKQTQTLNFYNLYFFNIDSLLYSFYLFCIFFFFFNPHALLYFILLF